MMKINLKSKDNLKLTKKEQSYFESRIMELDNLFRNIEVTCNVLVSNKGTDFKTEITIPTKHIILRAESIGDSLYNSIDLSIEKIEKQFLKHRKRINTLIRKREGIAQYFIDTEESHEEKEKPITKVKEVPTQVMSVDEAIVQLEMLDHDFFIFVNEADHKPTIVYIRDDGNYGTIVMK